MARREFQTIEEIDRYVSSIGDAESLLKNRILTETERELIQEWLEADKYGGKLRRHEAAHQSLERKIEIAKQIAEVDSSSALVWARVAFVLAVIALLIAIFK